MAWGKVFTGIILASVTYANAWATDAKKDEPDFLTISAGRFDMIANHNPATEFGLQYRSDYKMWYLKPHGGIIATTDETFYGYGGILFDIFIGNRFVLTGSTAVGYYAKGSGKNLHHPLEFRSGAELAYRFDDRSRLGLGIFHISNASIGERNPGVETFLASYSIPFNKVLGAVSSSGSSSSAQASGNSLVSSSTSLRNTARSTPAEPYPSPYGRPAR